MENRQIVNYTYADYFTWRDDQRWEVLGGVPAAMSPAPTPTHQRVLRRLAGILDVYLKGRKCEVFFAPFDVRLWPAADGSDTTVVQPDLVVICDPKKITPHGCLGAPDFIAEIVSPSTKQRDMVVKRDIYERAAVGEYWVIDPDRECVIVHRLDAHKYAEPAEFRAPAVVSPAFCGGKLTVQLAEIFEDL